MSRLSCCATSGIPKIHLSVLLLMVQNSQTATSDVKNPVDNDKLPASTGDRWISSINSSYMDSFKLQLCFLSSSLRRSKESHLAKYHGSFTPTGSMGLLCLPT